MNSLKSIQKIIQQLGGDIKLADIYMSLVIYGPQTISQLSRSSGIERTKIYRLIDDLQKYRLAEIELHPNRNIIKASPISSLKPLIDKKVEELKVINRSINELESVLDGAALVSPLTKVQFYRGKDGAKQMLWNQTKAKTETLSFLYKIMQSHTGEDFYLRWANKCNENNIKIRSLVGEDFLTSQRDWYKRPTDKKLSDWQGRYLPSTVHKISFWTCIYDDVTAYFNWDQYDIYGIEIYNKEISDANRSFFESLWKSANKLV